MHEAQALDPPALTRRAVWSRALFSVTTYLAQGVGGLAMGAVYAAHGLSVPSWIGAGGVFLMATLLRLGRRNLR